MNFAAVLELVTIVTYIVILAGGKQKRQSGWKVLAALLVVTGAVQCAAMAIVVCFPARSPWKNTSTGLLTGLTGLLI